MIWLLIKKSKYTYCNHYGCSNSNRSKLKPQIDSKKPKTTPNQIILDVFG